MIKLGNVGKVGTLSRFAANYCERIKQLDNHKTIWFPYCNHKNMFLKLTFLNIFTQLVISNPAQNSHNVIFSVSRTIT